MSRTDDTSGAGGATDSATDGATADVTADGPDVAGIPPIPEPWVVGPVTRTDFVRYQGASGDMNPIHHDEEYAKAAGFPTPFAVGMWQAGLLGTYATNWLGAENVRRFRIRFVEQVWPGDTLTCRVEHVEANRESDGRAVDVEFCCLRQTGGRAVTVWATFALADAVEGAHDE